MILCQPLGPLPPHIVPKEGSIYITLWALVTVSPSWMVSPIVEAIGAPFITANSHSIAKIASSRVADTFLTVFPYIFIVTYPFVFHYIVPMIVGVPLVVAAPSGTGVPLVAISIVISVATVTPAP